MTLKQSGGDTLGKQDVGPEHAVAWHPWECPDHCAGNPGSGLSHQEGVHPWVCQLLAGSCVAASGAIDFCGFGESPKVMVVPIYEPCYRSIHASNELDYGSWY